MSQIVVISGHPDLSASNTNSVILSELGKSFEQIDIRKLDELYPNFQIDVAVEQEALLAADVIVLQFPFYWYSAPAFLKKWIDDVFAYDFAYGTNGDKLKGKDFILSFTVGGPESSYHPLGYNHFTISQLLRPLEQTAYLSQMNYLEPIYSHGMVYIEGVYNTLETVTANAKQHAERLIDCLTQLNNPPPQEIITAFVKAWFAQLDVLPAGVDFYHQFINDNSVFTFPEGEFVGQAGFADWYGDIRQKIQGDNEHRIENITVSEDGEDYAVQLSVKLIAETTDGKPLQLNAKERWTLALSDNGTVTIKTYHVDLVL